MGLETRMIKKAKEGGFVSLVCDICNKVYAWTQDQEFAEKYDGLNIDVEDPEFITICPGCFEKHVYLKG